MEFKEKKEQVARTFILDKIQVDFLATLKGNRKSAFMRYLIDNSKEYNLHRRKINAESNKA